MEPCSHFQWTDEYVSRLKRDGRWPAPSDLPVPSDVEIAPSAPPMGIVAPPMGLAEAEVRGELKKLNKHLRQMNDLKKHANLIAAGFYLYIVALGFVYLLIVSRS